MARRIHPGLGSGWSRHTRTRLTPCCLRSPSQVKKKKNISHDAFGSTFGRVHMQKQDLSKLHTRKMKGLRKRRAEAPVGEQDAHAPKEARVAS